MVSYTTMPEKLFLFDGMALAYRAYFAFISRPLTTLQGKNVSAVYGFVTALLKVIDDEKPDHIGVCFDTKEPTFRHKAFKEYKATRQAMPDDMGPQLDQIKEIVRAFNIQLIELPGWEADDVIGTLAKQAEHEKVEAFLVTPDKDFCQLVSRYVKLYRPPSFGNEYQILDIDGVIKKMGVPPESVIEYMALVGDTSDNIPGVKGVGEKTALPLIQQFGTIANMYDHLDQVEKVSLRTKLAEHKDMAILSKMLVTIDTNAPVKINFHQLRSAHPDKPLLRKLFFDLNFKSLMKKYETADDAAGPSQESDTSHQSDKSYLTDPESVGNTEQLPETEITSAKSTKHKYTVIQDEAQLDAMIAKLKKAEYVSFDLETTSISAMMAEIVGLSFSIKPHEGWYIPVDDSPSGSAQDLFSRQPKSEHNYVNLSTEFVVAKLKPLLESSRVKKIGQNIKYDALVMRRYDVRVSPLTFDSMVASYIVRPDGAHDMDSLAMQYLQYRPIPISELIGTGKNQISMRDVDIAVAAEYAAEDADVTLQLVHKLEAVLKKEQLEDFCAKVEFPLVGVLVDIESNGVKIDAQMLHDVGKELERNLINLEREIYKLAGVTFNINSTKQLAEVLFDKLGLPTAKKTKTGFSTDVSVLEELALQHPVPAKILEFRQTAKLKSTYVDALPRQVNPRTGLIHTSYSQTVAATGRLSSNDPNLQNIPIRTHAGNEIRKAFIPRGKGRVILSADYSQIELRIMAHVSQDPGLIAAFNAGEDIHNTTAASVFGVSTREVTDDMRRSAKAVNFGIMYGLGPFGLAQRLGISQTESRQIIQKYFERFPGVKQYIDTTIAFAHANGYTVTALGRRRYYANINNRNANIRQGEERQAINMPIQGTAADMIKMAMINVHKRMAKEEMESLMIMQVHDELVFDAPSKEVPALSKLVRTEMENALECSVSIVVNVKHGANWAEAH